MNTATEDRSLPSGPAGEKGSPWSPLRHAAFLVLWVATVLSNIGTWMQSAAAGWLMTALKPDPVSVSLVQAAATLPMFLFSLPAGALADIVDRRRLLIATQVLAVGLAALFALLVGLGLATPVRLLAFLFASGLAAILAMPAWQAIVPELVPRAELSAAVALNGIGFNISRAVGPALAGFVIAALGMAAPYWLNAASTIAVIGALAWWRGAPRAALPLPAERFRNAMRDGLRYARHNRRLRATLIRSAGFFPLASVYWALLPLLARDQIGGGPELYGVLVGTIGGGAILGAFALRMKARIGAEGVVIAATVLTALALVLFAVAGDAATALVGCVLAGAAWIAVIATLNVAAQLALPAWVRGRGLAVFVTVQFAGLTIGSVIWGRVAQAIGLPAAHLAAAAGLLVLIPLLRRWRLRSDVVLDLAPSMHWPSPVLFDQIEPDRGPVLVTIEYAVAPAQRTAFLAAVTRLAGERRRDGAYDWDIYEDAAREGVFLETFHVSSWLEHMRQHQRVTNADRVLQDAVHRFHIEGEPMVRHLISARKGQWT
ncbi:MAG TPA: MFS transporter [Stellaceae bacterium]|nr:MFS transporter [Stellaceae bacterium]